ncbi:MAG: dicarboxylate/amino acid:cation symporter [Bacteroidales bacterium]
MKAYRFSIILIVFVLFGSILGSFMGKNAEVLKPLGDIFLNLLFTAVVPLVFFSIASAVSNITDGLRLGKILGSMLAVFIATGIIASLVMVVGVNIYPPAEGLQISLPAPDKIESSSIAQKIVETLTTNDFVGLFSKKNMLAIIFFALLTGFATQMAGEKGKVFGAFLVSANEVMLKLIQIIMYFAPIGLAAYFAYLIGFFGPQLTQSLWRAMVLYYPISIIYFFVAFTLYAIWAAGIKGMKTFWENILPASLVALGTGSSMATIPTNLEAANKTGVPRDISEMVIPIGATIHMDGSCLSAILKIALLFGLYGRDFTDPMTIITAVGVALLSGTVMSGIPGGGYIGEVLIIQLYGFPIEAMPIVTLIGTLVDPTATMVNSIGDNVASMMVARIVEGKDWFMRLGTPSDVG